MGGRDIFELVKQDLDARNAMGHVQYGGPLTTDAPRDFELELYQELMDAIIYLRGKLAQRGVENVAMPSVRTR